MDVVELSRIQFALTIMFHYLFPPLAIGMSSVLVYLEVRFLKSRDPLFQEAARFWTKIFALNFAFGVATGIVMEFEFGTNWATYSRFVGDVFGSALAAEGIFAFFLESGFLAVMVFGWKRVSPRMHCFATIMVAIGSIFSSVWIVIANSWQQTPAGHHVVPVMHNGQPFLIDGAPMMRAEIVDFWAMVFNPSTLHRLVHVWLGSFIVGAFFIMSISAYYMLRQRHMEFARRSFAGGLLFATLASGAILISGHLQAKNVYRTQPAKMAAFEAHFTTSKADLSVIGVPDAAQHKIRFNVAIPSGLSLLLYESPNVPVVGLDRFRAEDTPPLMLSFGSYHLMIGIWGVLIVLTLTASVLHWRGKLFNLRWLLWVFVGAVVPAIAANQVGWVAAEVGRQPWIVQPPVAWSSDTDVVVGPSGHVEYDESQGLRTTDAVSERLSAAQVLTSLIGFAVLYLCLGGVWLFVLDKKIRQGPDGPSPGRESPPLVDTSAPEIPSPATSEGPDNKAEMGVNQQE